ncbi:MAG: long-chain fatty acid--CoA ligase [Actinomycetota bacterium]|jgi:long-chain acyl-CoA synthetase|nr:long-chain fatty acid--CoA ligase [Actinomycetota bacterium]
MSAAAPTGDDHTVVENRASNVARMFLDRVERTPEREAYRFPDGAQWRSSTWRETGERVRGLAAGLIALGIEPEERVAIASTTRFEWILADLATMCAGAATTTVYPSTVSSDVAFILADSHSRIVFAEDEEQVAKLRERRSELPALTKVVVLDAAGLGTAESSADNGWTITLDELAALGERMLADQPGVVDERVAQIGGDNLATLIYTSGTTGRPKGVRIRHDSWTYEGAAIAALDILSLDDVQYLWLPMAHAFGKVLLTTQLQLGFSTAVDGRVDKIIDNLAVVKPTFMGAAPRIFEKAHGRIVTMAQHEGGAKAKIFSWATGVGAEVARRKIAGQPVPRVLAAQHKVADTLVFAKIRDRFGGRVRFFISGAAALNEDVARWFYAAGILILEGYGLTETSAGSAVNHPDSFRFGTVGLPFPGTEFTIGEDGEILIRGPGVMQGYHNLDDQTEATLDDDGWVHTGDVGEIDADGFVRITDRKKDLFKTSGGKYVAPSMIEGQFKAICPYAGQVLVHGAERNFCTAIVALDPEAITKWAERNGLGDKSYAEVVSSDQAHQMVQHHVDQLNERLNRWETIKRFVVLDHDLSVESGELTPSLKVKRKVVEDNHRDELDALYA